MTIIFIGNSHLDQFLLNSLTIDKKILYAPGASIKGLMNAESTTSLNKQIIPYIRKENILVFHMGQVDFEFGYYYKSVLSGSKLDKNLFIDSILSIYETYLREIIKHTAPIVVGLNPTTIEDLYHTYTVNFRDKSCSIINLQQETGNTDSESRYKYEELCDIYNDTVDDRNTFLSLANSKMKLMCDTLNIQFIDMWGILIDPSTRRIREDMHPCRMDHHVKPSVILRDYLLEMIMTRRI